MRILTINGIGTGDGVGSVDRVGYRLRDLGYRVIDPLLPRRGPFTARFTAERDADAVMRQAEPGDVLVAHSNGCRIAAHCLNWGYFEAAYLIAPAMSARWDFGSVGNPRALVYCYHSRSDWAVRIGALLPFHPFGRAGLVGFRWGDSDNLPIVENVACDGSDHDDYFNTGAILDKIVRTIHANHRHHLPV